MTKMNCVSRKKKRLSAEQRYERLLKAATGEFLEKGYAATNLDDIISRAGGSRRSIYTHFGGKEGLFQALVTQVATQILAPVRQEPDKNKNLKESLLCFANRLVAALLSPPALDLSRLALIDGVRFPELAKAYFEAGPGSAASSLAVLFDLAMERGEIVHLDSRLAARLFVGMLRDNLYLQVLLRLREPPEQEEREELVSNAVEIFLNGITRQE